MQSHLAKHPAITGTSSIHGRARMRTPHAVLDACILAAVIVQYSGDELLLQLNVIKVSQSWWKKVLVVLEHIVKIIAIGL